MRPGSLDSYKQRIASVNLSCVGRPIPRTAPQIRVDFRIPYRTRFGQRLNLVGSGVFGEWEVERAVPMTWCEGDVWHAVVTTGLTPGETIQYKYVVTNPDGAIEAWKPGDNIILEVPSEFPGSDKPEVRVVDAWDGTVHKVALKNNSYGDLSGDVSADAFLIETLKRSYKELELKLQTAQSLLKTNDPTSIEMLKVDKELAVVANKVLALTRAVESVSAASQMKTLQAPSE